jgi:molybdopterin synthase sulfur carrier subunit
MATVYIPSLMQKLSDGKSKVEIDGSSVRQIVNNLEVEYPGFKERLVEDGRIKGNISVAIDGEITPLGMLEKVGDNSEVHFLPAIGGGA